ncbi:hypothetical protein C2845_PM14G21100 [Panicum miliaceum]|uniref:Uncharacterized protein n=1 Tax=Panicum miliaceum TaxID=4540 RepID=A0A3L6PSX6_PANMI|nr:hypothetical protein C2845_PM14G21100 [Panicum miliaceum]
MAHGQLAKAQSRGSSANYNICPGSTYHLGPPLGTSRMITEAYPEIPVSTGRREASPFVRYDHFMDDCSREVFKDGSKPLKEFMKMKTMVAAAPCNTNEKNDECFGDFNEENLYASRSGRAKFYGVKRIRRDGLQAKRNYNAAHDIIAALFSTGNGKGIPKDIFSSCSI